MTRGNETANELAGQDQAGPERVKPACKLVGTDGNVFAIIGRVKQTLKLAGQEDLAGEFLQKAFRAGSYDEVLALCFDYVDVH